MLKTTIALVAAVALAGAAGAQMTGGNTMSPMQNGSMPAKAGAKGATHKRRTVTHRTTHHTTTQGAGASSSGTMGNTM